MLRDRGGEAPLRLKASSPCFFGVMLVDIEIHGSRSLKDRRQVVRSVLEQAHRHLNVSVSDLGPVDCHTRVNLAVACAANEIGRVRSVLDEVEGILERESLVLDFEILALRRKVGSYDEFSNRED